MPHKIPLYLLCLSFNTLTFAGPAIAQQVGATNPYGTDVEFSVGLREQRANLGEIVLHIGKDGVKTLSPVMLLNALGNRITRSAGDELLALPTVDGRADFDAFGKLGFDLTFSDADLDLTVTIPLRARPQRDYSVLGPQRDEFGDFDQAAGFSMAANLRLTGDYSGSDIETQTNTSATLGLIGRVAGIAYQSDFRLSQSGRKLLRDSSRLIYDDVPRALRWQLGDIRPFAASTVGGDDILGFGVNRETDALQPDRIARLRATQVFSIQEPSEVTISVNGRVVTRQIFAPGNYNIADFPFVQGRNQVELLIINRAGEQERLSFNQFLDSRLLEAGRDDFGLSIGLANAPGYQGSRTYDASNWAINAHYIKGVTARLTLGISATANANRAIVLGTVVHAGSAGATSGRFGLTANSSGSAIGVIGLGLIRAIGVVRDTQLGRSIRLGLDGKFDLDGSTDSAFNASLGYSWPLTRSVNANADLRVSGQAATTSFQTSIALGQDLRLDLAIDWRFSDKAKQSGPGFSIGLSRSFGNIAQGRARYDSRLGESRATLTNTAARGLGQWSTSLEAATSETASTLSLSGSAFYNRFEVATQANSTWQDGRQAERISIRLGTALAFADGQFAIGRPVSDSFAIIAGHKSLQRRTISLGSQYGQDNATARTGFFGPALVTGLGNYTPRIVSVAVTDPPEGYDIGSGTVRIEPPLFGGYRFIVGSDTPNSMIGTLILANGQPASLVAGVATSVDWPKLEPIVVFTNSSGQFSISGLGKGRWTLKMRDISDPFEFVIQADATNFIELGEIRARQKP